jgi:hypothetical protein
MNNQVQFHATEINGKNMLKYRSKYCYQTGSIMKNGMVEDL